MKFYKSVKFFAFEKEVKNGFQDEGSLKDKVLEERFRTVRLIGGKSSETWQGLTRFWIGTGSFGEIYLGADLELSRDNSVDVAIKVGCFENI